ncbi:MAG: FKBP-type peptidyl-prolyl cis-trans isomerase [Spirochaetales bacterium]|nr:FKBP-type peptidyl-prolyl cis-trans isomerase [Spirochaetales bacterium]
MKKLTAIILVLAIVLVSAVSCSKKQEPAPAATAPAAPATQTQTTTAQTEGLGTVEEKPAEPAPAAEQAPAKTEEPAVASAAETAPAAEPEAQPEAAPAAMPAVRVPGADEKVPQTLAEKFSYVFGVFCCVNYGDENAQNYFDMYKALRYSEMDTEFGKLGIADTINDSFLYTIEDMNAILIEYDDYWAAKLAADNLAAAESFLAENAKKEGVKTTESGLQYLVVKEGTGERPTMADSVELNYELTLLNGEVLDSSYDRGQRATFPMSGVIAGFAEGVTLMPLGSHYIFYIHPKLGYGEGDLNGSGGNQLLMFEVETYSIVK